MERFAAYLADIDQMIEAIPKGGNKDEIYICPKRKNLGCISIVLLREAIAPVVFRNLEEEITDIEIGQTVHIRAVPNKFKYPERGRGLQILRLFKVGGRFPQNKTTPSKGKLAEAFDLNTLVFGDSVNEYFDASGNKKMLSVKAAVNYSDALSLLPKHECVDETFHNRAAEDGTLYNAVEKKNSESLFTRHFIRPGTLMVQVLSTRGRLLPMLGLKHLMLSTGLAGLYGGQTSLTGTNIRTHIVGVYGDLFEQAITSPYELVKSLALTHEKDLRDPLKASTVLHETLKEVHRTVLEGEEVKAWLQGLLEQFDGENGELEREYQKAAPQIASLFSQWFEKDDASQGKGEGTKSAHKAKKPAGSETDELFDAE